MKNVSLDLSMYGYKERIEAILDGLESRFIVAKQDCVELDLDKAVCATEMLRENFTMLVSKLMPMLQPNSDFLRHNERFETILDGLADTFTVAKMDGLEVHPDKTLCALHMLRENLDGLTSGTDLDKAA